MIDHQNYLPIGTGSNFLRKLRKRNGEDLYIHRWQSLTAFGIKNVASA